MSTPLIQLDEAHVYRVNDVVTPGFSEIVKGVGLIDDRWFTETSRWRGSVVHAITQLEDENDLDEESVDPSFSGWLEAYRRFKRETGFIPEAIEQPVFNPFLKYCGTLDRSGKLASGRPALLDLKTGDVNKITRYQTVAYLGCLSQPFQYTRLAVGLKPNGKYSCKVYGPEDYRKDWSKWASIVDVYYLLRELGMLKANEKENGYVHRHGKGTSDDFAGAAVGHSNGEYGNT